MLFSYPLMATISGINARIGRVTGHGITGDVRRGYTPWRPYMVRPLLLLAGIISSGADIGAMEAGLRFLAGGSPQP